MCPDIITHTLPTVQAVRGNPKTTVVTVTIPADRSQIPEALFMKPI